MNCEDFGIEKCDPCKERAGGLCAITYCKNIILPLPKNELIVFIIDSIKGYFGGSSIYGSSIYLECAIKEYYTDKNLFETVKLLM